LKEELRRTNGIVRKLAEKKKWGTMKEKGIREKKDNGYRRKKGDHSEKVGSSRRKGRRQYEGRFSVAN